MVQRNRGIIALTSNELYNDPSIIIVKENSTLFPLEILLAIINSKLATFYHFNSSPKATKGAFPKILIYDVNNFPLPNNIEEKEKTEIEGLVKKILETKNQTSDAASVPPVTADTTALEAQIDRLVYQLYGLTEEEIAIVEQA